MERKLTKEQKFHELKKYCEDKGLHLMGENVIVGGKHKARFLFQHPQNRGKGQFIVLEDTFDNGEDLDKKLEELNQYINERYGNG